MDANELNDAKNGEGAVKWTWGRAGLRRRQGRGDDQSQGGAAAVGRWGRLETTNAYRQACP